MFYICSRRNRTTQGSKALKLLGEGVVAEEGVEQVLA